MSPSAVLPDLPATATNARPVRLRTSGQRHGPIVRLASPSDVGQTIKPFVFLDRVDVSSSNAPAFGFHPHSGIATLTLLLEGGFAYEDSTGASGVMTEGAVEWMQAGGGVWHRGNGIGERIVGYQLWIALPPHSETAPPVSRYLAANAFGSHGPARVILGMLGGVRSPIDAPSPMSLLDVRLAAGEVWRYRPPAGHDVAWVVVHRGRIRASEAVNAGELVVFAESSTPIEFTSETESTFVLGSAAKHPHPLVTGSYSVHTSRDALDVGEDGIRRIAETMRREGKL